MIPIILAGGSGTRFWPLSRRDEPKQLLSLLGDRRSMIEATVERLLFLTGEQRSVRIVCHPDLIEPTRERLQDLDSIEFIEEPEARNTGPAMILASALMEAQYGDEPLAFFPADHFIAGRRGFEECLHLAEARAREGAIVTLGILPTRPETGYGYIECDSPVGDDDMAGQPAAAFPVRAFVEKPDADLARQYLREGRFLWNSGIFIFRPSTLWAELRRQQPQMWTQAERIRRATSAAPQLPDLAQAFSSLTSISIDYAVMEGATNVEVIPARFRWSDVGHWAALDDVLDADEDGNLVDADALLDETKNCVIFSRDSKRLIATSGLQNLVIVDTTDALLVVPRDRAQRVRELVRLLEERDRQDLL